VEGRGCGTVRCIIPAFACRGLGEWRKYQSRLPVAGWDVNPWPDVYVAWAPHFQWQRVDISTSLTPHMYTQVGSGAVTVVTGMWCYEIRLEVHRSFGGTYFPCVKGRAPRHVWNQREGEGKLPNAVSPFFKVWRTTEIHGVTFPEIELFFWRSRCKGRIFWPTPHTYIHTYYSFWTHNFMQLNIF
jgi:hypothetical protein